jgi:cell division protein ZapA
MGELLITVYIADRPYRLNIDTAEEEKVRKAAKLVNDKIKEYASHYAYKDKQDLLSMVALQLATGITNLENKETVDNQVIERLVEIDEILNNYLEKD